MTNTQRQLIERLRRYFDNKDENEYKSIMLIAQKDTNFEKMVKSITTDRLTGANSLKKNNIRF